MSYPNDPNIPANHASIVSTELRDQFAGSKSLIDALEVRISALEINKAAKPQLGEFDAAFNDPPGIKKIEAVRSFINSLV